MKNTYFTPDIEDIRVGYECEIWSIKNKFPRLPREHEWQKFNMLDIDVFAIENIIKKKEIRVPYLTKEQIVAEGWEFTSEYSPVLYFKKGDWTLKYWYKLHLIELHTNDLVREIDKFNANFDRATTLNCECKCINDFRFIIKKLKT